MGDACQLLCACGQACGKAQVVVVSEKLQDQDMASITFAKQGRQTPWVAPTDCAQLLLMRIFAPASAPFIDPSAAKVLTATAPAHSLTHTSIIIQQTNNQKHKWLD